MLALAALLGFGVAGWNLQVLAMAQPNASGCAGDCNDDGQVTVDEIITLANIALGNTPVADCHAGDLNHDGQVTVDEILTAVNNALSGCPPTVATPTQTPALTPSMAPTPTATATSTSTSGLTVAEVVARDSHGGALLLNQTVTTEGTVTVSAGVLANNKLKIFIQSGEAGIMVYHQNAGDVAYVFQAGDRIRVTGVIRQQDPNPGSDVPLVGTVMIDISAGSWTVLSNGNPLPPPQSVTLHDVAANGITFTGVLVSVANVQKTAGTWPIFGGKSTAVTVSDDGGTTQLTLRLQKSTFSLDSAFVNKLNAIGNSAFQLVGIVVQDGSNFEIWIRGANDINSASP
ncbi:MAG: hypothetical protein ACHQ9S_20130 [Candidatus Binatia bacterium]